MKLIYYPDPVLRQKAEPVRTIDDGIRRIAAQMAEVMYEAKGLGLAAQQVGLTQNVFVLNMTGEPGDERAYVNARTVGQKGFVEMEEGCLSFPGLYAKVKRARQIQIEAYDLDGNKVEATVKDLVARAWQHEIDHLNGVLFVDRMTEVARLACEPTLKDFERAYARAKRAARRASAVSSQASGDGT